MIATLRQRNFALMWLAGLISLAGDWTLSVSLPIYVYTLTHSVLATAITLMCAATPGVLVGSVAGVFVDRWDHKRTMVATNATSPPLTPYAWRARRRHHRRQRLPTTSTPAHHHSPDLRITERTTDPMVLATEHRAPSTEHRAPSTEHRAPSTEHRAPSTPSPAATRSRSPNDAPH
jgi:transmembrane secretion effector